LSNVQLFHLDYYIFQFPKLQYTNWMSIDFLITNRIVEREDRRRKTDDYIERKSISWDTTSIKGYFIYHVFDLGETWIVDSCLAHVEFGSFLTTNWTLMRQSYNSLIEQWKICMIFISFYGMILLNILFWWLLLWLLLKSNFQ